MRDWLSDNAFGVLVACIVVLFAAVLGGLLWASHESPAETEMIYRAWMKSRPGCELSLAEWQTLRRADLLPGQTVDRQARTAAAVATGLAIGSAAARPAVTGGGRR